MGRLSSQEREFSLMTRTRTRQLTLTIIALLALALTTLSLSQIPTARAATNTGTVGCAAYPAPCAFSFPVLDVDGRRITSGSVREIVNVGQASAFVYDWTQVAMAANPANGSIKAWVAFRHVDQHTKYTLNTDHGEVYLVSDRAGQARVLAEAPLLWDMRHPVARLRIVASGETFSVYHVSAAGVAAPLFTVTDPQRAVASGGNVVLYTSSRMWVRWAPFNGHPL